MATELDKLVVKIEADLSDLKKGMAQANNAVKKSSKGMSASLSKLNGTLNRIGISMAKVGAIAGIAFGVLALKKVITTGMEIQKLEIRFNNLFGSVEEGNKAFKQLLDYAGTVPFSLGQIQAGSGSLAVVSKDAEHLRDIMEITGNVAVIAGLDFATTASQIQRVFAGGLAAADIFREKGISQIIKDTGMMVDTVEGAGKAFAAVFSGKGKFANATKEMAVTVQGNMSMIGDVLEQFTIAVAEGFFVKLASSLEGFRDMLMENREAIIQYGKDIGKSLGDSLAYIRTVIDFVVIAFKAFIALKIGMIFAGITTSMLTLNNAMAKFKFFVMTNPFFVAVTLIAGLVLYRKEIIAFGATIKTFIIDQFNEATFAVKRFLNSFKSEQSNFAALAERLQKESGSGMSGVDRYNIAFGADRESAQDKIANREKEKNARKFTKFNREELVKQGEFGRIYRAVQADANVLAFDKEMEMLELASKGREDKIESIQKEFENIGKSISTAFGEAVVSGKDFKDSMVDIFQSVAQQVVGLIFQLQVVDPLLKSIKASMDNSNLFKTVANAVVGTGNFLPNSNMIMGGINGPSMPLGAMAGGGSVNANMPYMVGERGAEMFVPKSAGNIVNSNNLASMGGGGGNIVIEQNLNFATGVSQTVRAEILNLLPAIQESTLGAVRDARLRGGSFAKDFGG